MKKLTVEYVIDFRFSSWLLLCLKQGRFVYEKKIRIRIFSSDPIKKLSDSDPVLKKWLYQNPVFQIWSDSEPHSAWIYHNSIYWQSVSQY